MRRRQVLSATAGAAAVVAAPRIGRAQGARALRFIPQADLSSLDPHWNTAYVTRNHGFMVFDTLYGTDQDYAPRPQMVEGHTVEDDGKRWTLLLREGLLWHDGTPVLARDCVASIRRWGSRDGFGATLPPPTTSVPEPASMALYGVGMLGLGFARRRRAGVSVWVCGAVGTGGRGSSFIGSGSRRARRRRSSRRRAR